MEEEGIFKGQHYKSLTQDSKEKKMLDKKFELLTYGCFRDIDSERIIDELLVTKHLGVKKFNKPHFVIVTSDSKYVEEYAKQLLKKVKKYSGKQEHDQKYDIRISRLNQNHIKECGVMLSKKHPNRENKKVLNIYISTP